MNEGWAKPWQDSVTGDAVRFSEDEALISLDLSERCDFHSSDKFCRRCLPRLVAAVDAARRCLDPKAEALVEYVNEAGGPWPKCLALSNPQQEPAKAFAMRFGGAFRLTATKTVLTSKRPDYAFDGSVALLDYVTKNKVCDAMYLRAFSVRLKDGTPEASARKLWDAKLSFVIDGERLVSKMFFKEFLGMKECVLHRPIRKPLLFSALVLDSEEQPVDPDRWIGYMLPNGTDIRVELDGIPPGIGLIQIETSFHLVNYTTRKVEV